MVRRLRWLRRRDCIQSSVHKQTSHSGRAASARLNRHADRVAVLLLSSTSVLVIKTRGSPPQAKRIILTAHTNYLVLLKLFGWFTMLRRDCSALYPINTICIVFLCWTLVWNGLMCFSSWIIHSGQSTFCRPSSGRHPEHNALNTLSINNTYATPRVARRGQELCSVWESMSQRLNIR